VAEKLRVTKRAPWREHGRLMRAGQFSLIPPSMCLNMTVSHATAMHRCRSLIGVPARRCLPPQRAVEWVCAAAPASALVPARSDRG
jgi:hypothetical protein